MNIVPLSQRSDAWYFDAVARLHESELQAGLLAKLGTGFLTDFYRQVAADEDSVVLVAVEANEVLGFVSGTLNLGRFYYRFLLRRGWRVALHLVPYLVRRGTFSPVLSFQRYLGARRIRGDLPASELTSLAIAPAAQRRGIGKALFEAFREYLRRRGIEQFKVSAATTQAAALSFYPALGARRAATTRLGELELVVFVCSTASVSS